MARVGVAVGLMGASVATGLGKQGSEGHSDHYGIQAPPPHTTRGGGGGVIASNFF